MGMREILFRGKTESGEFAQGYYLETLRYNNLHWIWNGKEYVKVDPSTIGQFTGLTDKNGKKIFEGDIVTACDDVTFSPFEFGITGKVVYDECAFFIEPKDVMETEYLFNECAVYEVIGNIHDNPELLEGSEGE